MSELSEAWQQIKRAQEPADEQARETAVANFDQILQQGANSLFVKTKVAEVVMGVVMAAAVEVLRQQFREAGKGELTAEVEASISNELRRVFERMHEQSTLDPAADQSSLLIN